MDCPPYKARLTRRETRRPTMYEPLDRNTTSQATHYLRDGDGKRLAPLSQLNTRAGRGLASSCDPIEAYLPSSATRTLGRKVSDRDLLASQRMRRNASNSTCSTQSLARSPSANSGSLERRPSVRRNGSSHVPSLPQRCDSLASVAALRAVSVVRRKPVSQCNARRFSFDYEPEILSVVTGQRDDTGASDDRSRRRPTLPTSYRKPSIRAQDNAQPGYATEQVYNEQQTRAQSTKRPPQTFDEILRSIERPPTALLL
jgi:hypothetical protein